MSPATCPETVDLYDHLEGAVSLDAHLDGCPRCREALAGLRSALSVEASAFAPPSELETERALEAVRARGRARTRRPWGQTILAFAAAAITLALLLPSMSETPDCGHPVGGPGGAAITLKPPVDANAPRGLGPTADSVFVMSSTSSVGSNQSNR